MCTTREWGAASGQGLQRCLPHIYAAKAHARICTLVLRSPRRPLLGSCSPATSVRAPTSLSPAACRRLGALELALKQTGSESAKRAADITQRAAVTEGSNAGIVKVWPHARLLGLPVRGDGRGPIVARGGRAGCQPGKRAPGDCSSAVPSALTRFRLQLFTPPLPCPALPCPAPCPLPRLLCVRPRATSTWTTRCTWEGRPLCWRSSRSRRCRRRRRPAAGAGGGGGGGGGPAREGG